MIPWKQLDRTTVPGGGGEISLHRRVGTARGGGDDFEIRIDHCQLMSSFAIHSEVMLADVGCEHLRGTPDARVLVGGLGMGFTLQRTLEQLPGTATVVVAELIPAVIAWNRGPLADLAGRPLEDPRTVVHEGDVRDQLTGSRGSYDAILLDVDNGPEGLTHRDNDWLYSRAGLQASRRALRAGGVLAIWSSTPDGPFTERLQRCGFEVVVHQARKVRKKGPRHIVWLARPATGERGRRLSRGRG